MYILYISFIFQISAMNFQTCFQRAIKFGNYLANKNLKNISIKKKNDGGKVKKKKKRKNK